MKESALVILTKSEHVTLQPKMQIIGPAALMVTNIQPETNRNDHNKNCVVECMIYCFLFDANQTFLLTGDVDC